MADFNTPLADNTPIGKNIGGVLHGYNLINDTAGVDAMGLVGATPAANTMLGRLKAIADAVTAQSAYVDGLEALATTLNGYVDTLETLQAATNTAMGTLLTTSQFQARTPTLGTKDAAGSVSTTPSNDQDPVFDHANAVKAAVTTASATAITPPAGCKYLRVQATADMFVRTDGAAAADAAGSIRLVANQVETIPVVALTAVTAMVVTGTGTLYATPMKVR